MNSETADAPSVKKVAEKLGILCYDSEIIQKITEETGYAPEYEKETGEYASGSFLSSAFSNRTFAPTNKNYHLTLDSGVLGIDKCVEIICRLF